MPKANQLLVDIGQDLSLMVGLPTIASWDTSGRPDKAKRGTIGFNFQTNSLEYWDGAVWFKAQMSEN